MKKFQRDWSKAKKWEVLQEAKKYLSDGSDFGKYTFLCHAVSKVYGFDPYNLAKRNTPVHHCIMQRLDGSDCLEGWLEEQGIDYYSDANRDQKLQATRHAWLDSMIAEFKAKG